MDIENKRNCNTCKKSFLNRCETLNNNEEYKKTLDEKKFFNEKEWDFRRNFICENYKSMYIEYPINVSKINRDIDKSCLREKSIGKFAMVRPCGDEYKGKTYLGIFLGELPNDISISYYQETEELNVAFQSNPAIFVFDLNKVIYGCESWWSLIEKEEDLKEITEQDINNVWYVKALNSMNS